MLYILLSGTPPFSGDTDEETLKAVRTRKYGFEGKKLGNTQACDWEY